MAKFAFIPKGVLRHKTIHETDDLPEVKFSYHPLTHGERKRHDAKVSKMFPRGDSQGIYDLTLATACKRTEEWDVLKPTPGWDEKQADLPEEEREADPGVPVNPKDLAEWKQLDPALTEAIIDAILPTDTPDVTNTDLKN